MATMQKKLTLADMQFAAESKGGLFLSLGYLGNQINHRWRCSAGHEWEAAPSSIRRGTWCSQCHRASTKFTLSDMREVARKKGGECLSTEYANSRTKILWRCGSGHEWLAQPSQVKIGHWCSVCAIGQKKLSIDDLRKLAAVKGGSCLSTTYRKNSNLLAWQCHSGHEWAATGTSVKSGQWCPHCLKYSIDEMKSLAMSRGGECLSDAYARIRDKLVWRCGHGHRWETSGSSIVRGGWCPACAGKKKLDLPSLQNLAATKGGRCLSNEYVDSKFPMLWQCADGHQWSAPASTIRRGSWCGPCGRKKPAAKLDGQPPPTRNASNIRLSLEDMRQLAKSRGGQCLSTRYERLQGELTWTCSRGHKWTANANNVKRGAWCPHCAGNKKASIVDAGRKLTHFEGVC